MIVRAFNSVIPFSSNCWTALTTSMTSNNDDNISIRQHFEYHDDDESLGLVEAEEISADENRQHDDEMTTSAAVATAAAIEQRNSSRSALNILGSSLLPNNSNDEDHARENLDNNLKLDLPETLEHQQQSKQHRPEIPAIIADHRVITAAATAAIIDCERHCLHTGDVTSELIIADVENHTTVEAEAASVNDRSHNGKTDTDGICCYNSNPSNVIVRKTKEEIYAERSMTIALGVDISEITPYSHRHYQQQLQNDDCISSSTTNEINSSTTPSYNDVSVVFNYKANNGDCSNDSNCEHVATANKTMYGSVKQQQHYGTDATIGINNSSKHHDGININEEIWVPGSYVS